MTCAHLTNRALLRLSGPDRYTFLQALVSNDVNLCKEGQAIHAALLTPQGKFLHDLFVIPEGESLLLDCEMARREDLKERLSKYRLRSEVALEEDERGVYAVWDEPPPKTGLTYSDPRHPALGLRVLAAQGEPGSFAAYDRHRLTLGVPDGSRDLVVGQSTLLEGRFDAFNGISWTKGCYLGQELTARTHYRGLVKRRLYPVRIEGPAPDFDILILRDGEEVGAMRSAVEGLGLALLREDAAGDQNLRCGKARLRRA